MQQLVFSQMSEYLLVAPPPHLPILTDLLVLLMIKGCGSFLCVRVALMLPHAAVPRIIFSSVHCALYIYAHTLDFNWVWELLRPIRKKKQWCYADWCKVSLIHPAHVMCNYLSNNCSSQPPGAVFPWLQPSAHSCMCQRLMSQMQWQRLSLLFLFPTVCFMTGKELRDWCVHCEPVSLPTLLCTNL